MKGIKKNHQSSIKSFKLKGSLQQQGEFTSEKCSGKRKIVLANKKF